MRLEVKDLMVGDEIIVPSQGKLKYVKVEIAPIKHPSRQKYLGAGQYSPDYYKRVKCSIRSEQTILPITKWRTKEGVRNDYKLEPDTSLHNAKIYLDLNYSDIWLVKRNVI